LRLRLAKASDITSIQKCNLATLPENYQSAFYASHLKSWPSLALVANSLGDLFFTKREKMRSGHVTSLAVLKEYRRLGLASQLMDQLHHQMLLSSVSSIGLHVRVTNKAATRLYETTMGYHVSRVIPSYYQDGEDAYLMNK
ncbi:hypothetical protein TL16_g07010, partial [Triparma laevis f. inornata]